MRELFPIYSAAAALVVLCLVGALAAGELHRRRRRSRDRVLRSKYLHIVMLAMIYDSGGVPRFPMIRRAGARLLLAETLARLSAVTYGLDTAPVRRIVAGYGLDAWLLRRIRRTRGYRRARCLALLARLPLDETIGARVARYSRSRNRFVRFYALMVQLAAEPAMSLRLIARYEHPFTACEQGEIMAMLRRGMLPIAYGPLLASSNRNLRMVGLGIVRQFGIEEAEPQLLQMAAADKVPELGREALYTLCSMRRPLLRPQVAVRLQAMSAAERRALQRYMAQEEYAPEAMYWLFDESDRRYYDSLVHSYKRCLVC